MDEEQLINLFFENLNDEDEIDFFSQTVGWTCPECGTTHAPKIEKCSCTPSLEIILHGRSNDFRHINFT
jgi:rubrerythrin